MNFAFRRPKKIFYYLEKIIDALPCTYKIAEKWNLSDHEKRVQASANLTRHVKFHLYSDMSDGNCCHDLITRK